MIETTHLEGGADNLRTALDTPKPPNHYDSVKAALDFYVDSPEYTEVYVVRCDACGHDMCLEVLEPKTVNMFMQTHHQGRRRITLGDEEYPTGRLLSHRKRLDGVMGYRCVCGNNTIVSAPEMGNIPTVTNPHGQTGIPSVEPHHEAAVRLSIARNGYQPDVEVNGLKTRVESFTIERIK